MKTKEARLKRLAIKEVLRGVIVIIIALRIKVKVAIKRSINKE